MGFEIVRLFWPPGKPLVWRAEDIATSFCLNNDVSALILIGFLRQRKREKPDAAAFSSKSSKAGIERGLCLRAHDMSHFAQYCQSN